MKPEPTAVSTPAVPAPFVCRPMTPADASTMSSLFFESFNAPFFRYAWPPTESGRKWWVEAWSIGYKDDTCRTFIVFDSSIKTEHEPEGKPVAFTRWVIPQQDGNLDRAWPALLEEWDEELMGAFFGGMQRNRAELMGRRPHWSKLHSS